MKPLAGLCLVLAAWLTWMGIAQFIYESRQSDLGAIRDGLLSALEEPGIVERGPRRGSRPAQAPAAE